MREWRLSNIEACEERLAELTDLRTDLEMQLDEIISEMEDLEYEIEQDNEAYWRDEIEEDDARERARDMAAALRDIGGTWL